MVGLPGHCFNPQLIVLRRVTWIGSGKMLQCVGALQSLNMHAALEWGRMRRAALRQMGVGWHCCEGSVQVLNCTLCKLLGHVHTL